MNLKKIISGGQSGVDRAALDWAIAHGIRHGGWCPPGRLAEDGVISSRYQLSEMTHGSYRQRTRQNVVDSDGTLILNVGELDGGTLEAKHFAKKLSKPLFILQLDAVDSSKHVPEVTAWLKDNNIQALNIAGPRESKRPGIYSASMEFLHKLSHHLKTNVFELVICTKSREDAQQDDESKKLVYLEIWIDGQHLDEPHPVDLIQLVRSLFEPGEFDIFTCGCGVAACAEIYQGIYVRHEPGRVLWHFRRPVSQRNPETGVAFEDEQEWIENSSAVEFTFERNQMVKDIQSGLDAMRAEPADSEYSPYGFERANLDKLSARRFSYYPLENQTRRRLYFLADQIASFLLDGEFVDATAHGLSSAFIENLNHWQAAACSGRRNHPDTRLEWLEETRAMILNAYREGIAKDIDLYLVYCMPDANGSPDPWDQAMRPLRRSLLDDQQSFELPYLCLSAGKKRFAIWLDDSPVSKGTRGNFVSSGDNIDGPILAPFKLAQELRSWAETMPADGDAIEWSAFHQQGLQLARKLKAIVGDRATVFYERSWDDRSSGWDERTEIVMANQPDSLEN